MTEPANIFERADHIKGCIATHDLESGLKLLLDFVRDFSENDDLEDDMLIVSMDYHATRRQLRKEEIMEEAARILERKMARRILVTIREVIKKAAA